MGRSTYILMIMAALGATALGATGSLLPVQTLADEPPLAPTAMPAAPAMAGQPTLAPALAMPAQPSAGMSGATEPDPLPGLPRPPDQPASLLRPAPAGPAYGCTQWESPYFQKDPRLDPPELPQPGWLFDVEASIENCFVMNRLGQPPFPNLNPVPFVLSVPMARLDWTVSPRFEVGHRLPAGFGEVDLAYRFVLAEGTGTTTDPSAAPDAPAALTSHLDMHVIDLDYASRETSLGPGCDMKWRIGLRYANLLFDSQADEPQSAAGSGVFERSISNQAWGIGPHAALELRTQPSSYGLRLMGRLDAGLLFGEVTQRFTETAAASSSTYDLSMWEQLPVLSGFLGLDWRPPRLTGLDLIVGYSGEYWWNVGRVSDPDFYNGQSAGEVGLQGPVFRVEYNY